MAWSASLCLGICTKKKKSCVMQKKKIEEKLIIGQKQNETIGRLLFGAVWEQ